MKLKQKTKKLASFPTSEGSMNVKGVSCVPAQIFTQKEEWAKGKYLTQQQIRIGSNGK
jgi:hypothetical protein